jgi:hypothetical protein
MPPNELDDDDDPKTGGMTDSVQPANFFQAARKSVLPAAP